MNFTTINTLNDDIFFHIFNYYRLDDENAWNFLLGWRKVSHVCRRWRHVVHSSAFQLGMHILCTNGTPTVDTLDHLPPLPLFIDYRDTTKTINQQDELAMCHALLLWDRVRHIDLHLPPSVLHKVLMIMAEPFPMLVHLSLSSTTKDDTRLVLPKTFVAPNLRHLTLTGIDIPERLRLLSFAVSLTTLVLTNIRASGYFPPRPLVAHLWSLPHLEGLTIEFSTPIPRPSAERELLGKLRTPVTLPNLKHFRFRGVSAYLECFVSQIRARLLERLDITLFNQIAFVLPHLSYLINTTEALQPPTATVFFGKEVTIIRDHDITQRNEGPFTLCVKCEELDWQIDCAAQICSALMPTVPGVQRLKLDYDGPMMPTRWENGEIDGTTWHELFRSFIEVNELSICDALSEELSRALQVDDVGLHPGFLPSLQTIRFYEKSGYELFGSFINARGVADRPVRLLSDLSLRTRQIQAESSHQSYATGGIGGIGGTGGDYAVDLNNWLQRSPEGNVTHELSWMMTQEGPNNQAVHHATAMFRGVWLGEGMGMARGRARNEAAKHALTYLQLNGLPPLEVL